MAFDPVLPIGNNVAVQPADFRRAAVGNTMTHDMHTSAVRAGVSSGFAVSVSGSSAVISAGCAVITPALSTNGSYWVSAGSSNTVSIPTKHATYDRIDVVGLRVLDGSADSSGKYEAAAAVVQGTASPSPQVPALPAGVLPLAELRVRSAGGISATDIREYTAAAGGVIPVINTDAPSGAALRVGTPIYVTKQGSYLVWTGSSWRRLAYADEMPKVPQIAAGSILVGGPGSYTKVVPFPPGRFRNPPIVVATINSPAGNVGWNTPKVFNVTASEFSMFVETGAQVAVNWVATDNG